MTTRVVFLFLSCLASGTLFLASCGTRAETTSPATAPPTSVALPSTPTAKTTTPEGPKHGGTLTVASSTDVTAWDPFASSVYYGGLPTALTNQTLWAGDWAKGPAGGYGTNESDWAVTGYDIWTQKTGLVAESWKWTADAGKDQGTIVYKIREGTKYTLNPASEASRLANGRELTADDVVFSLKTAISDSVALIYSREPSLRIAEITKTAPWEVTIKVPFNSLELAIRRFGHAVPIFPKEVLEKYAHANEWQKLVGTGPLMVIDFVPGSVLTYARNSKFWMKDPIGPGKGSELPYIDRYKVLIIADASTQQAALRTGKIDVMTLEWEDAAGAKKSAPALIEKQMPIPETFAIKPRVDQPPFNDVRVRRAMMMATDFQAINKGLRNGQSQILNYPITYYKSYGDVYLGLDDPDMPNSIKELYAYNPDKAKALLKEAGYPSGFKTTALMDSSEVDLYSIYRDMWSKVGIEVSFDVREVGAKNSVIRAGQVEGMTRSGATPIAGWSGGTDWVLGGTVNPGRVNDPIINNAMTKVKADLITNLPEAKRQYRELLKYVLDQAYAIPVAGNPQSRFWWPWLKNYSGEVSVGYLAQPNWIQWVWIDQDLKRSMGH